MNPKRLAQALNTISVGFAEAAEALNDIGEKAAAAVPSFDELPPPASEGHLSVCPKHHVPYTEGQYGLFCKQATDDPAWGKQKGDRLWCRITPENAAEYLRIKAAAQ